MDANLYTKTTNVNYSLISIKYLIKVVIRAVTAINETIIQLFRKHANLFMVSVEKKQKYIYPKLKTYLKG